MAASGNTWNTRRIVVHTSEPGLGAARYVFEFVKGLVEINASVVLFCPSNFEYLQELEACGIEVFLAGARGVELACLASRILRNLRFFVQTAWRQLRVSRSGDIIHFQFPLYFPLGLCLFLLAALKNCPIVFTAHDPLPHKWLWPERFRWLERKMLEWGYRLSQRIIVHNETGRKTLIREFGINPDKLSVIPHGPFALPQCSPNLPPFGELRILAFGSIRENKGTRLAIQAVQLLNARSGLRVRLTIAGGIANAREESYWRECKSLIEKQPDGIRVIEGSISDADVGALLADHHALLLPYLDFSSESGVASLALSNRRPILATRAGGLGTLLASCECGIPIESATAEGVAAAIAKARDGGREMLERMGAEGEAFVSSTRSWRQIGTETLALYAEPSGNGLSAWSNKKTFASTACQEKRKQLTTRQVEKRCPGRVLMLITSLTLGGAETQVVRLATELKKKHWVVAVACLLEPSAYVGQLESIGIPVHSLGMTRGLPDPRAIWRLRSLIRDFEPDIVHSHMVHANLLGRIVRLTCCFPTLICTAHNLRETSEKGGPTWHKELLYRITDFLADRTTIICRAAFDRYLRVGAVPPGKLKMIPNGVDTEYFSLSDEQRLAARSSLGVENHFVWLAVGRLVEQKDYPNLLRALSLLGDGEWVVLIAGKGPLAEDLQVECRRLGLDGRVRFIGAHEDILNLYRAADAFVMSSQFEGLPVALLEASSMGLPSVVTAVGGNTDVVIDGVSGYVVKPRVPVRIARAMRSMMDARPERRLAFGRAARQHCLANYRFETIVQKWVDLYRDYLPASRRA